MLFLVTQAGCDILLIDGRHELQFHLGVFVKQLRVKAGNQVVN